jgi:hypothetical protein
LEDSLLSLIAVAADCDGLTWVGKASTNYLRMAGYTMRAVRGSHICDCLSHSLRNGCCSLENPGRYLFPAWSMRFL